MKVKRIKTTNEGGSQYYQATIKVDLHNLIDFSIDGVNDYAEGEILDDDEGMLTMRR